MLIRGECCLLSTALAVAMVTSAAYGQRPASSPESLANEVAEMKAENVALRDQLRRVEEQQKILVELVGDLRERLGPARTATANTPPEVGSAATATPATLQPLSPEGYVASPADLSNEGEPPQSSPKHSAGEPAIVIRDSPPPTQPVTATPPVSQFAINLPDSKPAQTAPTQTPAAKAGLNAPPAEPQLASTSEQPGFVPASQTNVDRYRDGIIIWETSETAKVPFLLKFNVNTQIRYLNTIDSNQTFTDHLGVTHDVHTRNDITVNRAMFILGGYVFDKRALYSFTVWTSAGAASIVVAGNIGWRFSKALTLTAGYTGVPGSRSLVATFPFFTSTDRSMADNFFRPGFTQGAWASGEPVKGLNYSAFVGNGLNTLSISANKIDRNLLVSGNVWWEPLGAYGEPGKARNMYDDYFASRKVRIRLGTAFTRSREDRFSNLDQSSPENTSLYNSDGVLTFATGALAPGVTIDKALYKLWAADGGIKWNGLAVNGQYFMRWLSDFRADGPLPLTSTFDHGGELSASYFVKPKKLMPYVRTSWVRGQFGNSYEYGAGVKWHFVPTERLWFNAEVFRINRAPYSGAFTPYTAGLSGWVPMLQALIAF